MPPITSPPWCLERHSSIFDHHTASAPNENEDPRQPHAVTWVNEVSGWLSNSFIIHTTAESAQSLKQPIRIAFTLTPGELKHSSYLHDVVAFYNVLSFPAHSASRQEFVWDLVFNWDVCTMTSDSTYKRRACFSSVFGPGNSITLNKLQGDALGWGTPVPCDDPMRVSPAVLINNTGSPQTVQLRIKRITGYHEDVVVYHSVAHGERIVASSDLRLQAYIVDGARNYRGRVLLEDDLARPLFAEPLRCDVLPAHSTWSLSQALDGEIRLVNDTQSSLGQHSIESLAKSVGEVLERLVGMERTIQRTQDDVASGQDAIVGIRDQLSGIQRSAGLARENVEAVVEARTDRLEESFGETRQYLSGVQTYLEATRYQMTALDRMLPAVNTKTDRVLESVEQTREDLSAVQAEVMGLRTDLSTTQAARVTAGDRIARLDRRLAVVEAKVDALEGSLPDVRESTDDSQVPFPSRLPDDTMASATNPDTRSRPRFSQARLPELPKTSPL